MPTNEINKESKDKLLENIKCNKCKSEDLKAVVDRSFTKAYITCNDCNTANTYTIKNGKLHNLVRCSICGSSTTDIITENGYSCPDWTYPELENLDDIEVLCSNCFDEHIGELEDKNAEKNKERVNNRIKELKKKLKEEENHTRSIVLTEHQINYILALIESDDDFASEICLDEDIEDDYEFEETKKIYGDWQNNLVNILT